MLKRAFDILVAAVGLILLLPLMVAIAAAVRISLGSPIFFTQLRPGLFERSFRLIKFRTMTSQVGAHGEPLPDAQRLTRFGAFLRQTSLDELPELLNVLRGDMSIVGPRPLLLQYVPLYSPKQRRRHNVRPGLTGLAQVRGRNDLSWDRKLALDVWYVDHRSCGLDLKILMTTVLSVLRREGIAKTGHATTDFFTGNSSKG